MPISPSPHYSRRPVIRLLPAGLLAAIVVAGCSSGDDPVAPSPPPPTAPEGPVALKQFTGDDACDQLESRVKQTATQMMREQIARARDNYGRPMPIDAPGSAPVPSPAPGNDAVTSAPESGGGGAGQRYSDTNVQVAGVDELDPVKNDGQFMYSLTTDGNQIILSQASLRPDTAMSMVGQVRWPATRNGQMYAGEQPSGLFRLESDRLLAVSQSGFNYYPMPIVGPAPATDAISLCSATSCGPPIDPEPSRTHLRLFSTGVNQAPAQTWQTSLPGRMVSSRRIGDRVYIVSEQDSRMPAQIRWWPQRSIRGDIEDADWDALIQSNTQVIENTALTDWLPIDNEDGSVSQPTAADCQSYAFVDAPTRLGWLRVNTVDITAQSVTHQTIMAHASSIYMAPEALIVTTRYWPHWSAGPTIPRNQTYLHRFTLNSEGQATYNSSGKVSGSLINRFAIDEANGVVRLALSDRDSGRNFSYIATMREQDGALKQIGRSGDIAPGETLRSARFVKDRAYLVTAIVIDPFFVYDLSDPTQPRQLGELKIPGVSTYLHPVGENHVLGIGLDAVATWPRKIKASLFDVTNPANPVEQYVLTLGDSFTSSDALWDPHAFTLYYPQEGSSEAIMAIPVRSYSNVANHNTVDEAGIRLVDVRPDNGTLSLRGTLEMQDLIVPTIDRYGWRGTDPRRAIFIDDTVYGVADKVVRSANISDPGTPLDTLMIP